jgi:hypothetical protein
VKDSLCYKGEATTTTIMVTCLQPVYPPMVIKSVKEQMDAYYAAKMDDEDKIPESMKLKPCMISSNLKDAVVC